MKIPSDMFYIFHVWEDKHSLVKKSLKLTLKLKYNDIWPFDPSQGPQGGGAKKYAVARPIYVSNSHTKFGWILSNGLGDCVTDGRAVGRTEAIAISPTF